MHVQLSFKCLIGYTTIKIEISTFLSLKGEQNYGRVGYATPPMSFYDEIALFIVFFQFLSYEIKTNHVHFQSNQNHNSKSFIDNPLHLEVKLNRILFYKNMKHDLCLEHN